MYTLQLNLYDNAWLGTKFKLFISTHEENSKLMIES